ncbi:hypothetical protein [Methanococcus voltae]|uniref:hypothetical protein n=1 Tax=Methanococcus voltae TaxID=2188 RepID=UPI001AE61DEA|nr:hypothetical protein [Methanococcus voltae]MBP2173082.1 hypothetical protein [Methanococcus voltae]
MDEEKVEYDTRKFLEELKKDLGEDVVKDVKEKESCEVTWKFGQKYVEISYKDPLDHYKDIPYPPKCYIEYEVKTGVKENYTMIESGKKYKVYSSLPKIRRVLKKGFILKMPVGKIKYNSNSEEYEVGNSKDEIYMRQDSIYKIWYLD